MQRREFITLLGASTFAWPLAARAQQATGVRRVAFLHPYAENDAEVLARVIAFREGFESLGWTENRNIRIEHRSSGGALARIRACAKQPTNRPPSSFPRPLCTTRRRSRQPSRRSHASLAVA